MRFGLTRPHEVRTRDRSACARGFGGGSAWLPAGHKVSVHAGQGPCGLRLSLKKRIGRRATGNKVDAALLPLTDR